MVKNTPDYAPSQPAKRIRSTTFAGEAVAVEDRYRVHVNVDPSQSVESSFSEDEPAHGHHTHGHSDTIAGLLSHDLC